MAIVSSHTLSSVDGSHAGGIAVSLHRIGASGARHALFEAAMDSGGRLSETVDLSDAAPDAVYELTFQTGRYFQGRSIPRTGPQILSEIVIRFTMPEPDGRYHIPLMIAPNSYSVWWSS